MSVGSHAALSDIPVLSLRAHSCAMTTDALPSREETVEALKSAAKMALLAAGNADSLCFALGDGRYVVAGTPESVRRLLPIQVRASNDDEVRLPNRN